MHELIPQIVNFTALVAVLFYVIKKPAIEAVAQRRETIRKEVEEARIQKLEADKKFKEFEKKMQSLESEAKQIIDQAKQDAEALKAKIIENAIKTSERLVKDADTASKQSLDDSKNEIRREVVGKALELAEKLIREKLSRDDQTRMISEYVGKVEQK